MIVYTDRHVDHAFVDRFLWWPVRCQQPLACPGEQAERIAGLEATLDETWTRAEQAEAALTSCPADPPALVALVREIGHIRARTLEATCPDCDGPACDHGKAYDPISQIVAKALAASAVDLVAVENATWAGAVAYVRDLASTVRAMVQKFVADPGMAELAMVRAEALDDCANGMERAAAKARAAIQPAPRRPIRWRDTMMHNKKSDAFRLLDYVTDHGADHDEDCPGDDTCDCSFSGRNAAVNRLVKALLDESAAPPVPETPQGWQPIETAPKDGTVIDVWMGDADASDVEFYCGRSGTRRAADWSFHNGKFRPALGLLNPLPTSVQPTHWQPLPAAPAAPPQEDQ